MPVPDFFIEPLSGKHDRAGFSCSVKPLETYLRHQARQDIEKRVAAVFVLTPDGREIAGYYALSQFSIKLADIPAGAVKRLPRYPEVPATLLGRLAVSDARRGSGLGEKLLIDALRRCRNLSKEIASFAVVVDAKDVDAKSFYQKYGFIDLPGAPHRLFLPMKTIERLF